jgi:rod shape-determining protein MreD
MDHSSSRRLEEHLVRHLLQALAIVGLALLQVTLLPPVFGFPPNPLLLLSVLLTLIFGVGVGARMAFIAGVALDLLAATPLGSHTLALLAAIAIVAGLAIGFRRENPLLPVVAVFVGSACYELIFALAAGLVPLAWESWRGYFAVVVLPSTLLATVPALPLFLALRWWSRREGLPEIAGSRL